MSKKAGFAPDGRSPLGRKMIAANMLQHMEKVQQSKSTIDDHLVESFIYFSLFFKSLVTFSELLYYFWTAKIGPKKRFVYDEMIEVKEASRRTQSAKPGVDSSLPKTFNMYVILPSSEIHMIHFSIILSGKNKLVGTLKRTERNSSKLLNISAELNICSKESKILHQ